MEDCYGLMGLKVTLTDLDFFLGGAGGGEGVKLFHCIVRTGVYGILCA